jgi:DNA polymerase
VFDLVNCGPRNRFVVRGSDGQLLIVHNCVQTLAGDLLKDSMPRIEHAGYQIVLSVHDELVCEAPDTDEYSSDALARLMATNPAWAPDLPLSAAGFEAYRYKKE